MKPQTILWLLASLLTFASAEPDFPLTGDSQPKPGLPKGEWIDGRHVSPAEGPFPGTSRDYRLYLPAGVDRARPLPFMVFQDGVVYQAPVVFDNLISRKEIPAMAGVFVKPGVVPAANEGALPRFNRSFEYDGVTDAYADFLIDEFLPALEKAHGIRFSRDPDEGRSPETAAEAWRLSLWPGIGRTGSDGFSPGWAPTWGFAGRMRCR